MVTKKASKKAIRKSAKRINEKKKGEKIDKRKVPTLQLKTDRSIAQDFAVRLHQKFDKLIKSVILFGSVTEQKIEAESDIDIIVVVDDVAIHWDQELIAFYREELEKILKKTPYEGKLHINTIKLSTWWDDLLKGDPVILNVIRQGFSVLDYGGFFLPLKYLMSQGKLKSTPEMVYQCLQRAPNHLARSYAAELTAIDGIYWSMVDSAHAALIAAGFFPPSPEHVIGDLRELADYGLIKPKHIGWYREIYKLHKQIDHREILDLRKTDIDLYQDRADEFYRVMVNAVKEILSSKGSIKTQKQ